jgi:murein DD-endopeptidase MepM/ murein hydrolase activator NlpD
MRTPIDNMPESIPMAPHQGGFGATRKYDIHTGIDLYCEEGDNVYAIEDGEIINICWFTGPKAGLPWWNDTRAILVKGKSGVILYGELDPLSNWMPGMFVKEGDVLGKIKTVLKEYKGLPMNMLHLELYEHDYMGDGEIWYLDEQMPEKLKDPMLIFKS